MLKICEICGTEFETNRTNKICCSDRCSQKRWRIQKKNQGKNGVGEIRKCIICGNEFKSKSKNHICCSKKCQVKRNCIVTEQQRKNRYYEEKQKNLIKEAMPKSNHDAIANIAIAARKEGLTYGQYVAKYMGRKA